MSKSLDFCKRVATDPKRSFYIDRNWEDATEIDSTRMFDNALRGCRNWYIQGKIKKENIKVFVELKIKPDNDDFQYFTSATCLCDGTLLFTYQCINECINKVLNAHTRYKVIPNPKDGDKICYTVGNFVILYEHDENGTKFAPSDRPHLRERITCLLPIKYELVN